MRALNKLVIKGRLRIQSRLLHRPGVGVHAPVTFLGLHGQGYLAEVRNLLGLLLQLVSKLGDERVLLGDLSPKLTVQLFNRFLVTILVLCHLAECFLDQSLHPGELAELLLGFCLGLQSEGRLSLLFDDSLVEQLDILRGELLVLTLHSV